MKEKIITFFKTKGYYMVLGLCVLTVGLVSFLSYKASQKEQAEIPLTDEPGQNVEKVEDQVPDTREETSENNTKSETTPQAAAANYSAPMSGEVIAHYSPDQPVYSYTLQDWRVHNGIDIAASAGTEVKNVCDGVVESAEMDDLTGNTVVVRHTDGKVSRYCSLETIAVTAGQMVNKGDTVGTIGTSMLLECGETAHLHYELWADDQPADPTFLISNS